MTLTEAIARIKVAHGNVFVSIHMELMNYHTGESEVKWSIQWINTGKDSPVKSFWNYPTLESAVAVATNDQTNLVAAEAVFAEAR